MSDPNAPDGVTTVTCKYPDGPSSQKTTNNRVFAFGIPENYSGGVLYVDGKLQQTTHEVKVKVSPEQCFVPEFDQKTYESHREAGLNSYLGTLFEYMVFLGYVALGSIGHVYMDIMSDLFGSPQKLRRKNSEGKTEKVSCFPIRNILHYLRYCPDETRFAITICSPRRSIATWKIGIQDEHYFSIYDKTLKDIFKACGFEVVSESDKNRPYVKNKHPMSFFYFHLRRTRPFSLSQFEEAIPTIYCEKHCFKSIGINRWFPEYKQDHPEDVPNDPMDEADAPDGPGELYTFVLKSPTVNEKVPFVSARA